MEEFNQEIQESDIADVMKKALRYYDYIDIMGEKLSNIAKQKIEPLLEEGKFAEAKQLLKEFYHPSRHVYEDGDMGDVIFIEYDLIMASINRRIKSSQ